MGFSDKLPLILLIHEYVYQYYNIIEGLSFEAIQNM